MTQEELKAIGCTPIEELIAEDFGEVGTPERTEFELSCDAFIIGEQLKSERIRQGLTQDELANRIGTKKSFISRVENGHVDIQLSTLSRLFNGLGRRVAVTLL
ncbi:MAG: helix-turn-helix domain-containing protein [Bacteroidaceae bacterium]|nr:helix-turn-helix domain-containing protein [Bacteroidaceae bacterium]